LGTALSFLIPLVDVAAWVKHKKEVPVIQYIPQMAVITANNLDYPKMSQPDDSSTPSDNT